MMWNLSRNVLFNIEMFFIYGAKIKKFRSILIFGKVLRLISVRR